VQVRSYTGPSVDDSAAQVTDGSSSDAPKKSALVKACDAIINHQENNAEMEQQATG